MASEIRVNQLQNRSGLGTVSFTDTGVVFTGVITATRFVGDAGGLSGIVGSGSGVIVRDSGSLVGTAGTIDFGSNLSVSAVSAGVVTVTGAAGGGGGSSYTDSDVDTHLNRSSAGSNEVLSWSGSDYDWVAQTTAYTNSDVDSHLNQSNPTSGYVLSWSGSDYAWVDNAGYSNSDVDSHLNQSNPTSGHVLSWNGSDYAWVAQSGGGGGSSNFTGLSDTPGTLTANQYVKVNSSGNALEFVALPGGGSMNDLTDDTTPELGGDLGLNGKTISGIGTIGATKIITGKWTLGANGTSDYTFTGPGLTGTVNDPTIRLLRGQSYEFVNNSGGHPFRIQTTVHGSAGTQYNTGVTNNDAGNGTTLTFDVPFDAPDTLFYQCTSHPNMGGKIVIMGDVTVEGSFTATASVLENIDSIMNTTSDNVRTAEYTFHFEHANGMQAQKALVMQDGSIAYAQQYAIMNTTANPLVSVGASISSGNLYINVTPGAGVNGITTYRFSRQTIR